MTADGPRDTDEERLCYELRMLFEEFADRLGEHRAHEIFKGMTAAIGKTRLRGKRGRTNPAIYSTDPKAVRKRKQRDWFERLVNKPSGDIVPGH